MMKRILVCAMAMAVTTMAVDFKGMDAPTKHVTPPKLELKGDRIELTIPKAFRDIAVRVVTHSLADAPNEKRVLVWEGKGQKTISVPRFEGPHDRLFKSWEILDLDNRPVTKPFHVVKVEAKHVGYEKPLFRPKEIKGVSCVVDMQDASDLGAKHIHTNLSIGHLWTDNPKNAIMHKFDGRTYMINKGSVEGFDRQLQEFYRRGISVFVVFTNTYTENPILKHPGTQKAAHMTLAGFNTATPEGIDYFAAVCDFLAARGAFQDQLVVESAQRLRSRRKR